jgi:ankyrin repeat protein
MNRTMPNRALRCWVVGALLVSCFTDTPRLQSPGLNNQLLTAAQQGDVGLVAALLAKGAAVDAQNEFELTPLIIAADKGNADLVRLLVSHGANVNLKDPTYGKTALRAAITSWSDLKGALAPKARTERGEIIELLLEKGANGGEALGELIGGGYLDAARTVIGRGDVPRAYLNVALSSARRVGQADLIALLTKAGAAEPAAEDNARSVERFKLLAGNYRSASGKTMTLSLLDEDLMLDRPDRDRVFLLPLDLTTLRSRDRKTVVALKTPNVPPAEITLTEDGSSEAFARVPTR